MACIVCASRGRLFSKDDLTVPATEECSELRMGRGRSLLGGKCMHLGMSTEAKILLGSSSEDRACAASGAKMGATNESASTTVIAQQ